MSCRGLAYRAVCLGGPGVQSLSRDAQELRGGHGAPPVTDDLGPDERRHRRGCPVPTVPSSGVIVEITEEFLAAFDLLPQHLDESVDEALEGLSHGFHRRRQAVKRQGVMVLGQAVAQIAGSCIGTPVKVVDPINRHFIPTLSLLFAPALSWR